MSGHNRWSKIKHKKEASDAKKSKVWTKVIKEITVSAGWAAATQRQPAPAHGRRQGPRPEHAH
jgi:transcriptional/translational regulatory protein YebC/TACO1